MFNREIISYFYKNRIALILTFLYGGGIVYLSSIHVVWRDEVRALSIAMDNPSIMQLFKNLHNEGHPFLWYVFLWLGFQVTHSVAILKCMSILAASGAAYLVFSRAPFTLLQKVLLVLGFFPIYQYSVVCRGYGLSMALFFLFCCLYTERFKKIILVSVILFLLANSEAHALIIVSAIFLSLVAEMIFKRNEIFRQKRSGILVISGFVIIVAGILLSVLQIYPDETSIVTSVHHLQLSALAKAILPAIIFAGASFQKVWTIPFMPAFVFVWFFYLFLLRNVFLLSVCLLSFAGMSLMGHFVYPLMIYHSGFFLILMLGAFWMEHDEGEQVEADPVHSGWAIFLKYYKNVLLYMLLISQVALGFYALVEEFRLPASSSKSFGKFLREHQELKEAIVISEPDFIIESVPYYAGNQIYIPREARFGKTVKFTTENKREFSLEELLNTARDLKREYQRPVIIVLGLWRSLKCPPFCSLKRDLSFARCFGYAIVK